MTSVHVKFSLSVVASLSGEMAAQSFAYHAHRTADSDKSCCYPWFVCLDKTLDQQCILGQARPSIINHLISYHFVTAHKPCHCTSHVKVFTTKQCLYKSQRGSWFKEASHVKATKWYGLWKNEEFKGVGMLLRKQWDSYTQTSMHCYANRL